MDVLSRKSKAVILDDSGPGLNYRHRAPCNRPGKSCSLALERAPQQGDKPYLRDYRTRHLADFGFSTGLIERRRPYTEHGSCPDRRRVDSLRVRCMRSNASLTTDEDLR